MSKKMSTEKEVILHRLSTRGNTWDSVIAEAELTSKQLKKTLAYLRERKRAGDPFPVQKPSTQN